jgi:hypothetical protein
MSSRKQRLDQQRRGGYVGHLGPGRLGLLPRLEGNVHERLTDHADNVEAVARATAVAVVSLIKPSL